MNQHNNVQKDSLKKGKMPPSGLLRIEKDCDDLKCTINKIDT